MMVSYSIAGSIIANESIVHYTMQKFSEAGMGNLKQVLDKFSKLFFEQPAVYRDIIPVESSLRKITTLAAWNEAVQSGSYFDADKLALLSEGLRRTTEYQNFIKGLKNDLESFGITEKESYLKILDKCEIMMGEYDYVTNPKIPKETLKNVKFLEDVEILGQYISFHREFANSIGAILES
ncbi:hypothetical protein [Citrobacter freundii]|nr:hypothetical protein [Citrobacter freundii]WNT08101.1 hypothetical protein RRL16_05130 [Citrobacter freundii]HCL6022332.1 hypothetical protein [Citrobacter freundii]